MNFTNPGREKELISSNVHLFKFVFLSVCLTEINHVGVIDHGYFTHSYEQYNIPKRLLLGLDLS